MREVYLHPVAAPELLAEDCGGVCITQFPFLIGRGAGCDHHIASPFISRRHCVFFLHNGDVYVEDLGSHNGTRLNGRPLRRPEPIHDGDQVWLYHLAYGVQMPAHPEAAAVQPGDSEPAPASTEQQSEHQNVLVVEDNEDTAKLLSLLLQDWGHKVHVAHDGPQAIEAALTHRPDTVLLDIRLPGMDGYQLAQRLRHQAGLGEARLVALTGYSYDDERSRSKEAGINQLLTKPVTSTTLREVLRHSN
jgi:CheY-like chemotaxis protein